MTRSRLNLWLDVAVLMVMLGLTVTGGVMVWVLPSGTGNTHALLGWGRHEVGSLHFYLAAAAVILLVVHVMLHWAWICAVLSSMIGGRRWSERGRTAAGLALLGGLVVAVPLVLWAAAGLVTANDRPPGRGAGLAVVGPPPGSVAASPARDGAAEAGRGEGTAPRSEAGSRRAAGRGQALGRGVGGGGGGGGAANDAAEHDQVCAAGEAINGQTSLAEAARAARTDVAGLCARLGVPGDIDPSERLGRLKRWYGLSIYEVRRLACAGR